MFKIFHKKPEIIDGELAKELIEKNKEKIYGYYDTITLSGAEELAKYKGHEIYLQLETLSSEIAIELAKFDGESNFVGPCQLFLDISNRTIDTIEALSEFKGDLRLAGLKDLDRKFGKALAKFHGDRLFLLDINELKEDVADKLAESKAKRLRLEIGKIDEEIAESLARFGGENLWLEIKEINESIAEELAKFNGKYLHLDGFDEVDVGVARGLAKFNGEVLFLPHNAILPMDSIKELYKCKGFLTYFEKGYI